ncbi:MAG: hypothetical protein KGD64_06900, partial [Candidatus Heimdallarchaeota archaeon]|nr:hypothetical protein [Candidatus Heimdallarchaeota archaeon]
YIQKMGIKINSPKKIARNVPNILKTAFFGLSFIFALALLYNSVLVPAVHKVAGITVEPGTGEPGTGTPGGIYVDFRTTNQYIFLLISIMLTVAIFALLFAGIMYSINIKVNTKIGVAIGSSVILLTFYLLSQGSIQSYILEAFSTKSYTLLLVFLTDLFYYLLVSFITILVYHLSRRIELSILLLFIGFTFGYGAPSNVILQIIALKWGFPNFSDGITTTADILASTVEGIEYAGVFGVVLYPAIFYRDTVKFFKQFWITLKKQGLALVVFTLVVFVIELIIQALFNFIGSIFISLIIFIVLVVLVNMVISSRYGKQSYTGLMKQMTKQTLQMSEPIIPDLKKQAKFLERKTRKREGVNITLGTTIPVGIYFLIMYITTAITNVTPVGTAIFLFTAVPISIAVMSFATVFYFSKDPLIKGYFSYPIKLLLLLGTISYFFYVNYGLVYNVLGVYPLIAIAYVPFIIIPLIRKEKVGTLLLAIAGENKQKALKKLLIRKDISFDILEETFYKSPSIFRSWLALLLTKRGKREPTLKNLEISLSSSYPLERATASLCFLYLNDENKMERIIVLLENDLNPRVRNAIAYGLRYIEDIHEEIYKRIIDSQHYEDDAQVMQTLKDTISSLDQAFSLKQEEEEEEIDLEEI